jgi:hypothetical protein
MIRKKVSSILVLRKLTSWSVPYSLDILSKKNTKGGALQYVFDYALDKNCESDAVELVSDDDGRASDGRSWVRDLI